MFASGVHTLTRSVFVSSQDLRVFVDFSVKTLIKRIEESVQCLADFLNTFLFNNAGPDKNFKSFLCGEDDRPLLSDFVPPAFAGRIIPKSLTEAKMFPLGKNNYPDLTLAMGCLRCFDFSLNNIVPTHVPQCNFHPSAGPRGQIIRCLDRLDKYGPMAFEILYCVASGLGGEFLAVCNCNSAAEVEGVMKLTVTR